MQRKSLAVEKKGIITLIGDSTIDNRIWVDGLIKNYLYTRLGIKRDSAVERVKKSHRILGKPDLSVVENVMDMLPNYHIYDHTNDGFTTTDVLGGAYKDKVFGSGTFSLFPNEFYMPLAAGEEHLKQSQHIVVSVGGNNFREFLIVAAQKKETARINFIKDNLNRVLAEMRDEYIEIIRKIRLLNADAKIIIMTQYYPSATQNTYGIYPFMKEIGEILNLGGTFHNPMTVIHDIMKLTYTDVLKRISHDNIVVADITSSLNPFDKKNHVRQIEPSNFGGKKIAKMLKYIVTNDKITSGCAYRFYPEFFTSTQQDKHVEATNFDHWMPAHPWDLREGYSLKEEKIFRKYNTDQLEPDTLLQRLEQAMAKHNKESPLYKAAKQVKDEAERLSHVMPDTDLKKWKMSVILAFNVLELPKNNPEYSTMVQLLKDNAENRAIGKADDWKRFKAALGVLAGAAIIGLSIVGIPFSEGASLTGLYVAGSLLSIGAGVFFYHHRQKSLAKESSNLAREANKLL